MTQIITLATSKGGAGKTMLAQILIGALAARGIRIVAIDAEPSGALSRWARFMREGSALTCHHQPDTVKLAHLIDQTVQDAEVVVIDTAGFGNRAAAMAMVSADLVLVPIMPGEADVMEAKRTVQMVGDLVKAARRPIDCRVIFNRMEATRIARHTLREAAALPRLQNMLSRSASYVEVGFTGLVPDKGETGKEVQSLLSELEAGGWLPMRS